MSNLLPSKLYLLLMLVIIITSVVMLARCEDEPDPSVTDTSSAPVVEQPKSIPNIYIDQVITPTSAENRRELYTDLLSICQEEGVSIKALTESEFEQLGTIRLQRWIDENRTAYRLEAWDYQLAEPQKKPHCHFELVSSGRHVLIEEARLRGVRLDDNQSYEIAPLSNIDASLLLRSPARKETKPTDQISEVAGQPCVETANDEATICTWSGGVKWGFAPHSEGIESVLAAHQYQLFRSIILQQNPVENTIDKIITNTFVIGETFDEKAITPAPATALPSHNPITLNHH